MDARRTRFRMQGERVVRIEMHGQRVARIRIHRGSVITEGGE